MPCWGKIPVPAIPIADRADVIFHWQKPLRQRRACFALRFSLPCSTVIFDNAT
jgi:hypothetical protein